MMRADAAATVGLAGTAGSAVLVGGTGSFRLSG
jgi:hypothetical protein